MEQWYKNIQSVIATIDNCIKNENDEKLTLMALSRELGYSECYVSRKFREISGMPLKDYIRCRRLAFALIELRDTSLSILQIAIKYGFSSNEAFSRSFKQIYGVTPKEYRINPKPVILRTVIKPFDCYLMEGAMSNTIQKKSNGNVKIYFVKIPAHKFLHIRNYQSIGYWDFWQKQKEIPEQDCETICGLLSGIKGNLDSIGCLDNDSGSGQLMAWINEPTGRICSWGIPLAEAYGVRLPIDYNGPVPKQMLMMDIPEGEYVVFEHGPFDFETESLDVEAKVEKAMKDFDYKSSGYELDLSQGRVFYFYHDCRRFFKYVRPVKKVPFSSTDL